jgi:hypothetical protein
LLIGTLCLLWGCDSAPDRSGRGGTGSPAQAGAGAGGTGSPAQAGAGAGGTGSPAQAGAGAGGGAGVDPPPTGGAGPFDAGNAPDRNAVTPGRICRRLAEINCEAERFCCDAPPRDKASCLTAFEMDCTGGGMADRIAAQPEARFDAVQAERVFGEIERLASTCELNVKAFGGSAAGLRSMFTGSIEAGGDCTPLLVFDLVQAAAALVACLVPEQQACLPSLVEAWRCTPIADEGGACFVDNNCKPGLYCNNPQLNLAGGQCMPRRELGASCTLDTECLSLFCAGGACVPAERQVVYCPR